VIVFAVIAGGDYIDGFVARLTGQYSRFGALLDPFTDRLVILSAVVVCWHFELLPRWALLVAIAREIFMLICAQIALRKGLDLTINWPGRLAMGPLLGGLFFALAGVDTLAEVLFYIGIALALVATTLYLRTAWYKLHSNP
jgi:cardiolipin synthase